MKSKLFLALGFGLLLANSASADSVGACGWGSKLFDGQKGIIPQILAVTTNGTSGNQTFGITSGTSGCEQNGVVNSNWKMSMYMGDNMNKVARDMSVGRGEALESLASLIGVEQNDKALFFATTKNEFAKIFPSSDVKAGEVLASLKAVLADNSQLAKYSANI